MTTILKKRWLGMFEESLKDRGQVQLVCRTLTPEKVPCKNRHRVSSVRYPGQTTSQAASAARRHTFLFETTTHKLCGRRSWQPHDLTNVQWALSCPLPLDSTRLRVPSVPTKQAALSWDSMGSGYLPLRPCPEVLSSAPHSHWDGNRKCTLASGNLSSSEGPPCCLSGFTLYFLCPFPCPQPPGPLPQI